ncbi:hypothetical protein Halhy_2781 [Haliscomenobacter hydrossis DSM 1100]|uniref:Uncharacterized protein n=1 Tax=Haliscomenobacter hydrossis (strain ATCC 27775 / DSM 1100 / LMG 10767 / O) TaxID=760192 RepID=F4L216_HALH1|nr:hypothetical protein Halhy_2781 [Haliscomenobacter hydrossis DSM 1100]
MLLQNRDIISQSASYFCSNSSVGTVSTGSKVNHPKTLRELTA